MDWLWRGMRARCCGPVSLSHSAVSSTRLICFGLGDSSTFPGQWSIAVLTYAIRSAASPAPTEGGMCWLVCVHRFRKSIHSWGHKKHLSVISSEAQRSHLTARSHPLKLNLFWMFSKRLSLTTWLVLISFKMNLHLSNEGTKWHRNFKSLPN